MKFNIFIFLILAKSVFAGIHPSLLLFHEWDLIDCPKQVQKIINMGARKVNIVPTLHYYQEDNHLKGFCFKKVSRKCEKLTNESIQKFSEYLYQCLKPLNNHRIDIKLTPHLDAVELKSFWRNKLIFNPYVKYEDKSYYEVMLKPIIKAINRLNLKSSEILLSMQGEMGATIFKAPTAYHKLYQDLKTLSPNIKVGLSMNYNNINGDYWDFNVQDMQELINAVDFIGYSAYTPIKLDEFNGLKKHFSNSVDLFLFEWQKLSLYVSKNKKLIFSEVGIGGGTSSYDGKTIAATPQIAASVPHAGITVNGVNPWDNFALKDLRRTFYRELSRFFNEKANYQVQDAYIWNANSWDVLGLYPNTELFKDDYIIQKILKYKK